MRKLPLLSSSAMSHHPPLSLYHVAHRRNRLWSPRGRIGRLQYCNRALMAGLIYNVVSYLPFLLGYLSIDVMTLEIFFYIGSMYLVFSLALGAFVALQAKRRLNDQNRSGWTLILSVFPIVNVWLICTIIFARGTPGSNGFGPAPPPPTRSERRHFWYLLIAHIALFVAIMQYAPVHLNATL
ncbi:MULTISPECIES: DUF805 domain-containing protein [unclassified Halomonas]|uniref:DUF805 domain-containing protein n=1 Tax=unclassified Halomonas TaxID=2609666 RepID=UPI001C9715C1|nr:MULTISPECIES: DUF805 domain-containing protein [unclassified Halomonas]MBY5926837.1 DUF805 domain-containing protein [Halomonas sp. DP4Y7-2]MBY6233879.1 DUF805 domain-containing protein [Halomonas sp. DP4Y7-1]